MDSSAEYQKRQQEEYLRRVAAQQGARQNAERIRGVINILYAKYVNNNDGVVDVSSEEVFRDKAVKLGIPEVLALNFAKAAVASFWHIDSIQLRQKEE